MDHDAVLEVGPLDVLQQTGYLASGVGILGGRCVDYVIFGAVDGSIVVTCTHVIEQILN